MPKQKSVHTVSMPHAITHSLISKAAIERLPNAYASMPEEAPDYYFLGAQGGDLLFFYKPLSRRELNFGKSVHRFQVYELFSAMKDYLCTLAGEELKKARAYCLGYISHYSADVCMHPFIYNLLAHRKSKRTVHMQIENDWDVYFARSREGREVENYSFPFSPQKMIDDGVLFRLLSAIAAALDRRKINENALARALKNYERYLKLLHGACYKKAGRLEKLGLKKLSHAFPRRQPDVTVIESENFYVLSEKKGHNADELFERAADDSARRMILFLAALDGAPLPREEFNYHLLTGENLD